MLKDLSVQRKDWTPEEGNTIKLRGLTPTDISKIVAVNRDSFVKMFNGQVSFSEAIVTFPNMVAHMIALAAEEEDNWESVLQLPAGEQLNALDIIWELSHLDEHNLGKLFAGLAELMEKWKAEAVTIGSAMQSGSSASQEQSTDSGKVVVGI